MATLHTFDDVLLLLQGNLEPFRYPVLELVERYGDRYRLDAVFILRKLEEFVAGHGESLPGVLESYRHYLKGLVEERRQPPHMKVEPAAVDSLFGDPAFQRNYLHVLTLSTVLNRTRYELFLRKREAPTTKWLDEFNREDDADGAEGPTWTSV